MTIFQPLPSYAPEITLKAGLDTLANCTMPQPPLVMSLTLELKDKTQHVQLVEAVQQMHQTYKQPFELEQQADGTILLYGCSELDLDTILRKFIREFDIKLLAGAPQVSYRETITRKASIDYTHKKQSGGSGQFAKISLTFEPQEPGAGYAFESKVVGGSVPKEFIPGVEKGLESAKETGVFAGFPCIDFKVTLTDGGYHDVDSSVLAFEIAARAAFREGVPKAGPTLLEPIMKVEVVTPEDFLGDVIGDLNSRRGQVQGMDQRDDGSRVVTAVVPLANMFGYVSKLRSMTQGRATPNMEFDHYEPVPNAVAQEVKLKLAG